MPPHPIHRITYIRPKPIAEPDWLWFKLKKRLRAVHKTFPFNLSTTSSPFKFSNPNAASRYKSSNNHNCGYNYEHNYKNNYDHNYDLNGNHNYNYN